MQAQPITHDRLQFLRAHESEIKTMSDTEADRTLDSLSNNLCKSPLVNRYVNLQTHNAGHPIRNTQAWHAAAERDTITYSLLCTYFNRIPSPANEWRVVVDGEPVNQTEAVFLVGRLLQSAVYLWPVEIERCALAAKLPKHIISRDVMPFPFMFFSREVAAENMLSQDWILVTDEHTHMALWTNVLNISQHTVNIIRLTVPYGVEYPTWFDEQFQVDSSAHVAVSFVESVLQRLAFLNSQYVATDQQLLPREIRRDRNYKPTNQANPLVHVVYLRGPPTPTHTITNNHDTATREFNVQWWVTGHYRAQWYPSLNAHKVKWIAPYIKGPADKPFADHVVRKVVR